MQRLVDSSSRPSGAPHEGSGAAAQPSLAREHPRVEGELNIVLVDDTESVVAPWGLDDAIEGILVPRGSVDLNELLHLVWSLGKLYLRLRCAHPT